MNAPRTGNRRAWRSAATAAGGERPLAAAPLRSGIFDVTVRHERFSPQRHTFAYRLFYLALDLDELSEIARRSRLLRINRRGVVCFRERDYFPLGDTTAPLKQRVLAWCAAQGHDVGPGARVVLVSLPRTLGYLFNPVSFYFCYTAAGAPVVSVAEVTNTFRETKPFLVPLAGARPPSAALEVRPAAAALPELGVAAVRKPRRPRPPSASEGDATERAGGPRPEGAGPAVFHARQVKEFYVSPFSSVDVAFDFTLRAPGERLAIRIDDYDGARRTLHSTVVGERHALTDRALAGRLWRRPLVTLQVIGLIHWQAARLWAKAVPYFRKADAAERQRGFYHRKPSVCP